MEAKTKPDLTLPRGPALALSKALLSQAKTETNKTFRQQKLKAAQKLRQWASQK